MKALLRGEGANVDGDLGLILRMRNGSEQAAEEFVRKYYGVIGKYCLLHCRNKSDAEDMTQVVFEHFFRSFPEYRHHGKALNYLYTIAANVCRDFARREEPLPLEELESEPEAPPGQEDTILDVRRALQSLPQELRETAILYFFQDRKQSEIARILGIGLPLVKYRIRRARELLREQLREAVTV